MTKQVFIFTSACLLVITILTSCHTSKRQSVAHRSNRQPKFIGGIYMNGHNKTSATADAIKPAPAVKSKRSEKAGHTQPPDEPVSEPIVMNVPVNTEPVTEPKKLKRKYAELIGVKPKEIDNYTLYRFIERWYGTNYRLGGQDESGIDCSGFAQKLYGEVYGVDLLRTAMEQFKNCRRIKHPGDAEEGDLVFFKQHSKRITHVGVYLANDFFVHASTSQGVIISSLKEEYWHKHYAGMGHVAHGG